MKRIGALFLLPIILLSACSKEDEGIFANSYDFYAKTNYASSFLETAALTNNFHKYKVIANEVYAQSETIDSDAKSFEENFSERFTPFLYRFMIDFLYCDDSENKFEISFYFREDNCVYIIDELNDKVLSYDDNDSIYYNKMNKLHQSSWPQ